MNETIIVTLPDLHVVKVTLTYDGVNPEPYVFAFYDDVLELPVEILTEEDE